MKRYKFPKNNKWRFQKGHIPWTKDKKGLIPWNKGKKGIYSNETIEKIRKSRVGKLLSEKTKEKIRNNAKVNPNFGMKGKKLSIDQRKKLSKTRKRLFAEGKLKPNITKGTTGMKYTEETKIKMRNSNNKGWVKNGQRGKLCPAWKGGITNLQMLIRGCFKYRQWRSDIFMKGNYICVLCGKIGGKMHIDHYPISFSDILHKNNIKTLEEAMDCEEFWNINNGRILCLECHKLTDNYLVNKPKL